MTREARRRGISPRAPPVVESSSVTLGRNSAAYAPLAHGSLAQLGRVDVLFAAVGTGHTMLDGCFLCGGVFPARDRTERDETRSSRPGGLLLPSCAACLQHGAVPCEETARREEFGE